MGISKNIEGFVKISEIDERRVTVEEVKENYKSGEVREALITNTYPDKKRIYLSFKALAKQKEREEIEKYSKAGNEPVTTIGDLLQNEIDKKK